MDDFPVMDDKTTSTASEVVKRLDHYEQRSIDFIGQYLTEPGILLRIATGYFTLQGYNLLRPHLQTSKVHIMVGYDQNAPLVLHQEFVKEVMRHLRQWNDAERRLAVQAIVASIENGSFQIAKRDSVDDLKLRTRQRDHAKVYILDERLVVHGSVNLTISGLLANEENSSVITEHERVLYFLRQFERNWNDKDTFDVTYELLQALLNWLRMVDPYDVYLKTLDALSPRENPPPPRSSYKLPNDYQVEVVERMIRQIEQYRGSILIASTGLGKTIMAAHTALKLAKLGIIKSVIVFAPVATHNDWKRVLDSARLHFKLFTRNVLDYPKRQNSYAVDEIIQALEEADEYTYIVIDEAQYFANENRNPKRTPNGYIGGLRAAFVRVQNTVHNKNSIVTLMTATPFVKRARDVNNQLSLLPHTAPPSEQNRHGQFKLPFESETVDGAWQIIENDTYFDQFAHLPISTIITTSYVAKNYCTSTPEGDYLDFPDGRRYLPRVAQYRARVPIFLEEALSDIFENGYFRHHEFRFLDRDFIGKRSFWTIERQAIIAWMSSPLALRRVIEKTIDGSWDEKIPFVHPLQVRKEKLAPLLTELKKITWRKDTKFLTLLRILDDAIANGRKALVFVEVLSTAIYLEKQLKKARPHIRIANSVIFDRAKKVYRTKSQRDVYQIILDFAPEANSDKRIDKPPSKNYDVFITTDAFGVGVNLQDASVVVNYDLSWTPDVIIQRAGRVLRFWKEPRQIAVHTFTHAFQNEATSRAAERVLKRTEDLYSRGKQATLFTELPLLSEQDQLEHTTLSELNRVTIEHVGTITPDNVDHVTQVSPMLDRLAERRKHIERANHIPDDIISALEKPRLKKDFLYLLLKAEGKYQLIVYDVERAKIAKMREDEILDLIHCEPTTPAALVNPLEIEQRAQNCVTNWCAEHNLEVDQVERICTLYLTPDAKLLPNSPDFSAAIREV